MTEMGPEKSDDEAYRDAADAMVVPGLGEPNTIDVHGTRFDLNGAHPNDIVLNIFTGGLLAGIRPSDSSQTPPENRTPGPEPTA